MDELYSIDEIEGWIEDNPGGNNWLLAILHDGERGIARFATARAVDEADAQDAAGNRARRTGSRS